jgi:hypothetical protein
VGLFDGTVMAPTAGHVNNLGHPVDRVVSMPDELASCVPTDKDLHKSNNPDFSATAVPIACPITGKVLIFDQMRRAISRNFQNRAQRAPQRLSSKRLTLFALPSGRSINIGLGAKLNLPRSIVTVVFPERTMASSASIPVRFQPAKVWR